MQLAEVQVLVVGWLLTCLVECLSASPQRPYWTLPQVDVAINYPEYGNQFPLQVDHKSHYQGLSSSPYENIDQFQLEQRRQPQYVPSPSQLVYNHADEHRNQFRNDQESYYHSLLRVTENPFKGFQNYETFVRTQEPQAYYQDYLPLDDDESFNMGNHDSKNAHYKVDFAKAPSGINDKVKDPIDQKVMALMTKILVKGDSYAPSLDDLNTLNSLESEIIADDTISDEIKRAVRQVRGQPGLLWTLARLAFEKVNDTKSAVNQIGTIINNNFAPEEPPALSITATSTTTTTTSSSVIDSDAASSNTGASEALNDTMTTTTTTTTTTTEAPFRLTRTNLQGIIRRNLKGLIRLFNIEWRDALNQSRVSVREFQRDLGNQIRPYLEDNPKVN